MIARLRSTRLGKLGLTAGAVVLGLVALDLVASAATLALGWRFFSR
jgi:hypothetical protein